MHRVHAQVLLAHVYPTSLALEPFAECFRQRALILAFSEGSMLSAAVLNEYRHEHLELSRNI